MRAGDILVTVNGEYVVVEQIAHELLEEPDVTYNFEAEDFHTYYVGKNTVLVHNKCILSPKEFFNKPKTAKEVIAYLKDKGFTIVKQEGSHVKLTNGVYTTVVPNHGSKDIAIGTLKAIMKEAGLG